MDERLCIDELAIKAEEIAEQGMANSVENLKELICNYEEGVKTGIEFLEPALLKIKESTEGAVKKMEENKIDEKYINRYRELQKVLSVIIK